MSKRLVGLMRPAGPPASPPASPPTPGTCTRTDPGIPARHDTDPVVITGFGARLSAASGHVGAVLAPRSSQPSLSVARRLAAGTLKAVAECTLEGSLGIQGSRLSLEQPALRQMAAKGGTEAAGRGFVDRVIAKSGGQAWRDPDHEDFSVGYRGRDHQQFHAHGTGGFSRLEEGHSSYQQETLRRCHQLHFGERYGSPGDFEIRLGGAGGPSATMDLQHGDVWALTRKGAGELAVLPEGGGLLMADRLLHHRVSSSKADGVTITHMVKIMVRADTEQEAHGRLLGWAAAVMEDLYGPDAGSSSSSSIDISSDSSTVSDRDCMAVAVAAGGKHLSTASAFRALGTEAAAALYQQRCGLRPAFFMLIHTQRLAVYLQRQQHCSGDFTPEVLEKMRQLTTPEALRAQLAVEAAAVRAARFTAEEEVERLRRWGDRIPLKGGAPAAALLLRSMAGEVAAKEEVSAAVDRLLPEEQEVVQQLVRSQSWQDAESDWEQAAPDHKGEVLLARLAAELAEQLQQEQRAPLTRLWCLTSASRANQALRSMMVTVRYPDGGEEEMPMSEYRYLTDTLFGNKSAEEAGRAGRKAGTEKQRQGGEWYLDRPAPPKSLAAFQQKTGRTLAPGTTGRQLGGAAKAAKTQSGLTDVVLAVVADTLYVPPDRKALLPNDQLACFEGLVLKGCRAAPNKVPDWPDVVGALLKDFPGEVPALTKGQWRQQVWKRIRALRNKGVQGVPTVGEVAQHMREEKEREAAAAAEAKEAKKRRLQGAQLVDR